MSYITRFSVRSSGRDLSAVRRPSSRNAPKQKAAVKVERPDTKDVKVTPAKPKTATPKVEKPAPEPVADVMSPEPTDG